MKETWEEIKSKSQEKIVLIKSNDFYKTYDNDALIIWNIFKFNFSNNTISFPIDTLTNVINKLNNLGISVLVIDNKNNTTNYESKSTNYKTELNKAKIEYKMTTEIEELKSELRKKHNYYK